MLQALKTSSLEPHLSASHLGRLMLFDLSIHGHHPGYIQYLIDYWHQHHLSGELVIVVSPQFLTEHADVVERAKAYQQSGIQILAIRPDEDAKLATRTTGFGRNLRNFQEWQLCCRHAQALHATQILVMYFDTYQLPLALGMTPPCPVSGIYFRPTFHYPHFTHYRPSGKAKLLQAWEKALLRRILRSVQCHTLFSLDPLVVNYVDAEMEKRKLLHLPDPVNLHHQSDSPDQSLKTTLGIEPDRIVFLLFGALTGRKGVYEVLNAISLLPPAIAQRVAFAFVGRANDSHRQRIDAQVEVLTQQCSAQIIRHYTFVAEQDVLRYFQMADVALAPYQRHVGMSGILILAAAAQTPVLSTDYGLMGELVRRYQLGLTVDSTQPAALAQGITQCVEGDRDELGDRQRMQQFATDNSSDAFARVIFERLRSHDSPDCPKD